MKRGSIILVLLLVGRSLSAGGVVAGDTSGPGGAAFSVQSNIPGVKVVVDTMFVGETPILEQAITAGTHVLHFVHPGANNWLLPPIVETIAVRPSDHFDRTVIFPTVYHIVSDPYGAAVHYHDSVIGLTPLIFAVSSTTGILQLTKDGYDEVSLPLPSEGGIVHTVLRSRGGVAPSPLVNGEQAKSLTPVYLTSGAAVVSGMLAAYFKIKSDGKYDDYRANGDHVALEEVRRYDAISGVAIAVSEVNLLLLSYFLLSR